MRKEELIEGIMWSCFTLTTICGIGLAFMIKPHVEPAWVMIAFGAFIMAVGVFLTGFLLHYSIANYRRAK